MQKLLQGIHRFERGISGPQRELFARLADGQHPDALFITCSDSRISPNLITQTDPGELFIIRNAGNTIDTAALGSVEYGVGVLGCPLVVVLGHEKCGAVAAAVDVVTKNATFPGVIGEMIQSILPAVLSVRDKPGDLLENAVEANARRVAARLKTQSPVLLEALRTNRVKVIAANYDLDDGSVDWYEII